MSTKKSSLKTKLNGTSSFCFLLPSLVLGFGRVGRLEVDFFWLALFLLLSIPLISPSNQYETSFFFYLLLSFSEIKERKLRKINLMKVLLGPADQTGIYLLRCFARYWFYISFYLSIFLRFFLFNFDMTLRNQNLT